ncbi:MAG: hypothetical protein M1814_005343 [Vezdaea aestivalis]|nr:MAG: hypothetical protein M1814_005343 [Vezdaea aestivalis]
MTYGYNAKFQNFTGHQDLRDIALKLLTELIDVRQTQEEIDRPIVFICHSLGGIVAKKALLIKSTNECSRVQSAVYGIIFLATPHTGSSVATVGKIIANIISACSPMFPAKALISKLKPNSQALYEVTQDFIILTPKLKLVSLYEMEMTGPIFLRRLIVDRQSALLNLPNEVSIGQNADHRGIARFYSQDDPNLRPIVSRLIKFQRDLEGHSREEEISIEVTALTGGCGKTQLAVQYAYRNILYYKSAVIFINASSTETITTDFSRVAESMGLQPKVNGTNTLKSWLSAPNNRHWLLIFDNADELAAVCLSKYYPKAGWGHIIVTSRDQSAIGYVSQDGTSLERLTVSDAVSALLDKVQVRKPDQADREHGKEVAELLGCLPLAIDQAAAYMRTRQRGMSDYLRLYKTKQQELLRFQPRLSDYDRTVLTAWDVNFRQVESESMNASKLLLVLCFLDPAMISENLLLRSCTPQQRWSHSGEVIEISAEDAGVDSQIIQLVTNEILLDEAIERLLSFSLVQRNVDTKKMRSLSVHPLVQFSALQRVNKSEQEGLRCQAILMVSHAFPEDSYLDKNFGNEGREQLPHVLRVIKEYQKLIQPPREVEDALSQLLFSASNFSSAPWKKSCLKLLKSLSGAKDDSYLAAWIAQLDSRLLRLHNHIEQSQTVLEEFVQNQILSLHDKEISQYPRWNSLRGQLMLSYSENLIQSYRYEDARQELLRWEPLNKDTPSTLESLTELSRDTKLGRLFYEQGKFSEALERFERVISLSQTKLELSKTGQNMSNLRCMADTYCELGRGHEIVRRLEIELEDLTQRNIPETAKMSMSLRLCLVEVYLCVNDPTTARPIAKSLEPIYANMEEPNHRDRTARFRNSAHLARIAHMQGNWQEALDCWTKALALAEDCKWTNDFFLQIARLSLATAQIELGERDKGLRKRDAARARLNAVPNQYWITGLGTYWYDIVKERLAAQEAHYQSYGDESSRLEC